MNTLNDRHDKMNMLNDRHDKMNTLNDRYNKMNMLNDRHDKMNTLNDRHNKMNTLNDKCSKVSILNNTYNLNFLNYVFIPFIIMAFVLMSQMAYAKQNMDMTNSAQTKQIENVYGDMNDVVLIAAMGQISNENNTQQNAKIEANTVDTPLIDPNKYEKPSEQDIKKNLSAEEYEVTQQSGTERPYSGKYVDNKAKGIYVDIVTGEPLFTSTHKYDSKTGWPSFTKPIQKDIITAHEDTKYGMIRTEIRSRVGDSHLGHVFNDGPKNQGGLRYCINSAALRFVAYEDMEKEGYGYLKDTVK